MKLQKVNDYFDRLRFTHQFKCAIRCHKFMLLGPRFMARWFYRKMYHHVLGMYTYTKDPENRKQLESILSNMREALV